MMICVLPYVTLRRARSLLCRVRRSRKNNSAAEVEKTKERLALELAHDVERLPVVRIDAIAPESRKFNWKDYFRRLLIALEEPESLIDRKVIPNQSGATFQSDALRLTVKTLSVQGCADAVEQTLRRRRPLAVLVDDARLAPMGSVASFWIKSTPSNQSLI